MKRLKTALCFALSLAMTVLMFSCSTSSESVPKDSGVGESVQDNIEENFVNYIDPDKAEYKFDMEEMITPFYLGNVIYNETVLLEDNGETISGKLQFTPVKILSVRDYTLKKEFSPNDYFVEGKTLNAKRGSDIPCLTSENLQGKNIPDPYKEVTSLTDVLTQYVMMAGTIYTESPLLYGNQVSVSYVYDLHELKLEEYASYKTSGLPKLKAKLRAGEDVKIVLTGDSVAEGCSSSKKFNHEPFMDNWADQFVQGLNEKYSGNIVLSNQAKGGMASEWGIAPTQISKMKAEKPDAIYIHFGINDLGGGVTAGDFQDNIRELILSIQASLPDCEFVIIKAFPPSECAYDYRNMEKYWKKMDELTAEIDNVYTLDMFTQGKTMLATKKYFDVTGNGINHVNDFTSRLYAMNLLASLIEY